VCALIRVKLDEKWRKIVWGTPPPPAIFVVEKNEICSKLCEMARNVIQKKSFFEGIVGVI
jgi:hypothetical protein